MSGRAITAVKGMNDFLPAEVARWHTMESTIREVVRLHGYREIRIPVIEQTPLYLRSVGETTDIVEKEMYSFTFHDDALTVRPEGTAGVVRAYVEHAIHAKEPVSRFYYEGPMFRGERPARGRYRQFHQAGCEVFGDLGPVVDAEMIDMLVQILERLKIREVEVLVNTLGTKGTKERYRGELVAHLEPRKASLSEDSQRRLGSNPLRILDSKDPRDQEAIASAPSILDVIDEDDRKHFDGLRRNLDALGTPYRIEPRLVRGLDYYSRTLFELRGHGGELGAQNALGGGGRYDSLVEELGGPSIPGIGFAFGLERLLLATELAPKAEPPPILIAPLGDRAPSEALVLARTLREAGFVSLVEGRGGSLKSMLRRANGLGARIAIVVGDGEIDRGVVQLKDLAAHAQRDVPRAEVARTVAEILAQPVEGSAS
jgi:histidyl-tRNA synthetase